MSSSKQNFQNRTKWDGKDDVRTNTIRISTHEVNFSHHGLRFGEKTQNHQWSHWLTWCDSIDVAQHPPASRGGHAPAPFVTLVHMAWLLHESRQPYCCDSKEPDLGNKFWSSLFLDFFKKRAKIQKNQVGVTTMAGWDSVRRWCSQIWEGHGHPHRWQTMGWGKEAWRVLTVVIHTQPWHASIDDAHT
jgi:hypothetical protein